MQRHIPEANLLKQAFAALGNVALNMHTNAQLPVTVVDVFLLGLEQHRHDPEVQQRGMKAMFNLAGKPKGAPNHGPAGRALAKKEMQCGVLFSSVANVLRWHGQVPTRSPHFTCFTGTKVQILTQARQDAGLVFLALKLLGKFSEATGVQMVIFYSTSPTYTPITCTHIHTNVCSVHTHHNFSQIYRNFSDICWSAQRSLRIV